jgi:hypothetical protein
MPESVSRATCRPLSTSVTVVGEKAKGAVDDNNVIMRADEEGGA